MHPITAVQSEYSLFTRQVESYGILDTLRDLGIGFVAYSPLGRGFLTGQIRKPEDLPENDFRKAMPRFQGEQFYALHLSAKEEKVIEDLFQKIGEETAFIDKHTQEIILSQIDLLLNYANRFYERQFITRKNGSSDLLTKLNGLLDDYFEHHKAVEHGLPTVQYLAGEIGVSPDYLTDMLRVLTGQNTQQHIQDRLIEKAKEILSSTNLSVSEIACQLGFGYPQSFNKTFKNKTKVTPLQFRASFN